MPQDTRVCPNCNHAMNEYDLAWECEPCQVIVLKLEPVKVVVCQPSTLSDQIFEGLIVLKGEEGKDFSYYGHENESWWGFRMYLVRN